ncbi:MAG: TraR/DksA C4-type zinc finger protein [Candidatus Sungbacteria bacterium]|uniref:TraR/DksA C4-type zinc finger protein n=1 Tax=Candidatus Sungiibacteriota bacterium TaxID=2750080 RepID=A0A932YXN5_9BACT|nr:TraR/DksA C4-type zinc finger protein [Candidatus Sungbacteria bacterium]
MDQAAQEQFKTLLLSEKQRLESALAAFATKDAKMRGDWDARFPPASELAAASHSAQEEQADIREEFESELAQEQTLELRLQEVDAALERIRHGTFGTCLACGKEIPAERLGANPAAAYDIEHQTR